ncbi:MAG: carboxypeptidase-like regulatory domain-containing protein [Bacteroidales bacterium]
MKRFFILFSFILISLTSMGQEIDDKKNVFKEIKGRVFRKANNKHIQGAHILSQKGHRGSITDKEGYFLIHVLPSDTLLISSVGYKSQIFKINDSIYKSKNAFLELRMTKDTIVLDQIEIFPFMEYETFKRKVITTRLPFRNVNPWMKKAMDRWSLKARNLKTSGNPEGGFGIVQNLYNVFNSNARLQRKLKRNRKIINRLNKKLGRQSIPALPPNKRKKKINFDIKVNPSNDHFIPR